MKLLDALGSALVAALPKRRAPLSEDQRDELERRAEVNRNAGARRAERARIFNALLGGGRWIPRRPGWLGRRTGEGRRTRP